MLHWMSLCISKSFMWIFCGINALNWINESECTHGKIKWQVPNSFTKKSDNIQAYHGDMNRIVAPPFNKFKFFAYGEIDHLHVDSEILTVKNSILLYLIWWSVFLSTSRFVFCLFVSITVYYLRKKIWSLWSLF